METPRFFSSGMLKAVTSKTTGCGNTYAVKEWLREKPENDGRRVAVIRRYDEYGEFEERRDIALVDDLDSRCPGVMPGLYGPVAKTDIVIVDAFPTVMGLESEITALLAREGRIVVMVGTEVLEDTMFPIRPRWVEEESFSALVG